MALKFWKVLFDGSLIKALRAINSEISALQPIDSEDIVWEQDINGMRAHFASPKSNGDELGDEEQPMDSVHSPGVVYDEPDVVLAKVTHAYVPDSGDNVGYYIQLYENGIDEPYTDVGIMFMPEVAVNTMIPANSFVLAHMSQTLITGGNS